MGRPDARLQIPGRSEPPERTSLRDALEVLEWVRREMMRHGSPDFLRARFAEERVQRLVAKLLRE